MEPLLERIAIDLLERIAIALEKIAQAIDSERHVIRMNDIDRERVYKTHLGSELKNSTRLTLVGLWERGGRERI